MDKMIEIDNPRKLQEIVWKLDKVFQHAYLDNLEVPGLYKITIIDKCKSILVLRNIKEPLDVLDIFYECLDKLKCAEQNITFEKGESCTFWNWGADKLCLPFHSMKGEKFRGRYKGKIVAFDYCYSNRCVCEEV